MNLIIYKELIIFVLPGHDLHLEADVVAEGLIKSINIEIHQENGGTVKIEKACLSAK